MHVVYHSFVHVLYGLCILYLMLFSGTTGLVKKLYFCPVGWKYVSQYCFKIMGIGNIIIAKEICHSSDSFLFEIQSWQDQRAIETFLKESKILDQVWLDGFIIHSVYRPQMLKMSWATNLFPKITNFLMQLEHPYKSGICVVIDPRKNYYWFQKPCVQASITILCTKRGFFLSDYDPNAIEKQKVLPTKADVVLRSLE